MLKAIMGKGLIRIIRIIIILISILRKFVFLKKLVARNQIENFLKLYLKKFVLKIRMKF